MSYAGGGSTADEAIGVACLRRGECSSRATACKAKWMRIQWALVGSLALAASLEVRGTAELFREPGHPLEAEKESGLEGGIDDIG
ncbi:uncharacterized protein VTP21DRAFT_10920 [Calcarisporiella thermophila]|uniref:uncharacterized protein n=1 Tax=Calcarisporiella thermophila TaxID=911321 RepID=UPI003742F90E